MSRARVVRPEFDTDPELLRWHRDKRTTYRKLFGLAEDSGVVEDDPFGWKCAVWPSPLDVDITVELLEQWRQEWIAAGKLVRYTDNGKAFLFLKSFHRHQSPPNPTRNRLPLPEWLTFAPFDSNPRCGRYHVDEQALAAYMSEGCKPYTEADGKTAPQSSRLGQVEEGQVRLEGVGVGGDGGPGEGQDRRPPATTTAKISKDSKKAKDLADMFLSLGLSPEDLKTLKTQTGATWAVIETTLEWASGKTWITCKTADELLPWAIEHWPSLVGGHEAAAGATQEATA